MTAISRRTPARNLKKASMGSVPCALSSGGSGTSAHCPPAPQCMPIAASQVPCRREGQPQPRDGLSFGARGGGVEGIWTRDLLYALALVPAGSILPDLPRVGRSRAPRMRGRDGRVAEGARLESVYTGNRIVGSNPTPSAKAPDFFSTQGTRPRPSLALGGSRRTYQHTVIAEIY